MPPTIDLHPLRRTWVERATAAANVIDLSFNDLLRLGADHGLLNDAVEWRQWRELRNATSHAYNEAKAQAVASRVEAFAVDAAALLTAMEAQLGR